MVLPEPTNEAFCRETEALLHEAAGGGDVVVLGRAGALVLRDRPHALHVRLDGPDEARIAQGMRVEEIDEDEARKRLRSSDRARTDYVRHFYRADPRDPALYHLMIDSTALPLEMCVELILTAARTR
jgi:cytidylate kinase